MKTIILFFSLCTGVVYADFMDGVEDMVKSTLSSDEDRLSETKETKEVTSVRTFSSVGGTVSKKEKSDTNMLDSLEKGVESATDFVSNDNANKDDSLVDEMISTVKETVGIKQMKEKEKESFLETSLTAVKEVAGMKKVKEDNSYFDGGILGDMADMIELEKGETLGLPSVFGLNKKQKTKVFGSTILGDTLLGDVKDTGTNFYRGFKTTGESTEFMSGVMYKSSKMYNEMFHMYDDSPFNVFESDDDKDASILDAFSKGNEMLDIFD